MLMLIYIHWKWILQFSMKLNHLYGWIGIFTDGIEMQSSLVSALARQTSSLSNLMSVWLLSFTDSIVISFVWRLSQTYQTSFFVWLVTIECHMWNIPSNHSSDISIFRVMQPIVAKMKKKTERRRSRNKTKAIFAMGRSFVLWIQEKILGK